MPARRRHVVGPEVDRDSVIASSSSGPQPSQRLYRHDDGITSGGRLLNETVDLTTGKRQQQQHQQQSRDTNTAAATMTSRDRTNEFVNAVRSMQSRNAARTAVAAANLQNPRRARQLQSYSNFMMIAKSISKNISSTYTKLEKLALCKNPNVSLHPTNKSQYVLLERNIKMPSMIEFLLLQKRLLYCLLNSMVCFDHSIMLTKMFLRFINIRIP